MEVDSEYLKCPRWLDALNISDNLRPKILALNLRERGCEGSESNWFTAHLSKKSSWSKKCRVKNKIWSFQNKHTPSPHERWRCSPVWTDPPHSPLNLQSQLSCVALILKQCPLTALSHFLVSASLSSLLSLLFLEVFLPLKEPPSSPSSPSSSSRASPNQSLVAAADTLSCFFRCLVVVFPSLLGVFSLRFTAFGRSTDAGWRSEGEKDECKPTKDPTNKLMLNICFLSFCSKVFYTFRWTSVSKMLIFNVLFYILCQKKIPVCSFRVRKAP